MTHKIKFLTIVVLCVSLLLITACGNNKSFSSDITAEQILNAAKSAIDTLPSSEKFYINNSHPLDAYKMSLWADGTFEECNEFLLVSDYALYFSADNNTFEISVLKAESKADAEKLVSVFERRKQTLSQGDKAAYDPNFKMLMQNSQILVEGDFVIFLITPNNNAVITAIENLKQ